MSADSRSGFCPDKCSDGKPDRQMGINEKLLARFPESIQAKIKISGSAKRCTYCGLVYLQTTKDFGRQTQEPCERLMKFQNILRGVSNVSAP